MTPLALCRAGSATAATLLWLLEAPLPEVGLVLGFPAILEIPRHELTRSVHLRELRAAGPFILFVLLVIATVGVVGYAIPNAFWASLESVCRHPLLVLPAWLF